MQTTIKCKNISEPLLPEESKKLKIDMHDTVIPSNEVGTKPKEY